MSRKKRAPTLTEHRKLWVLTIIYKFALRETWQLIPDILPFKRMDPLLRAFRGPLLGIPERFAHFADAAARAEARCDHDWGMHYRHETPQGLKVIGALHALLDATLAEPIETEAQVHAEAYRHDQPNPWGRK